MPVSKGETMKPRGRKVSGLNAEPSGCEVRVKTTAPACCPTNHNFGIVLNWAQLSQALKLSLCWKSTGTIYFTTSMHAAIKRADKVSMLCTLIPRWGMKLLQRQLYYDDHSQKSEISICTHLGTVWKKLGGKSTWLWRWRETHPKEEKQMRRWLLTPHLPHSPIISRPIYIH